MSVPLMMVLLAVVGASRVKLDETARTLSDKALQQDVAFEGAAQDLAEDLAADPWKFKNMGAEEWMLMGVHAYMVLPSCQELPYLEVLDDTRCWTAALANCETASDAHEVHFNFAGFAPFSSTNKQLGLAINGTSSHLGYPKKNRWYSPNGETELQMHPLCAWTIVDDLRSVYGPPNMLRRLDPVEATTDGAFDMFQAGMRTAGRIIRTGAWNLSAAHFRRSIERILQKSDESAVCWTFTNDFVDMAKAYQELAVNQCAETDDIWNGLYSKDMTSRECCQSIREYRQAQSPENDFLKCPSRP